MRKLIFLLFFITFGVLSALQAQCDEPIELGIEVQDACIGGVGSVSLSIIGGVPPYRINGTQITTTDTTLGNLAIGTYALLFQDATDCVIDTTFIINELAGPSIESVSILDASPTCLGGFDAVIIGDGIVIEITDESGAIVASELPATNLAAGRYKIRVEDANGCLKERFVLVDSVEALRIDVNNIIHAMEECGTSGGNFDLVVSGGNPPYAYEYATSISSPLAPGTYNITVTDIGACSNEVSVTILSEGDCIRQTLKGEIVLDTNENCKADIGELVLPFLPMRVELVKDTLLDEAKVIVPPNTDDYTAGVRYTQENFLREYQLDFEFEQPWLSEYKYIKLSAARANDCSVQRYFLIDDFLRGNPLTDFQFLAAPFIDCPMLMVDIAAPLLRRGFTNTYYVQYCNYGNLAAEDAYIDIDFDADVSYLNSTLAADFLSDNTYRFNLGTVDANKCEQFTINVEVSNSSVLGQTHCTAAHIYPDAPCMTSPDWSGAEIAVDVRCENGKVIFGIENIGDGSLDEVLFSVVTEEIIMMPAPQVYLGAMERIEYTFPGNGSTYRLEVGQAPGFPFPSRPSAIIEGCGTKEDGTFSIGIVNMFPHSDYEPYKSIDCQENRAAYDPNDKRGLPLGTDMQHFIEPNTDIEYQIRFQNTGTDTAFNVVLLDTLPPYLDWESVQVGVSSHAYEFDRIADNVLRFRFPTILLPDSTTNEAASHGFINFRVSQRNDFPLGTVIENKTAIYFDYNEAIFTNTTLHTVDINFLQLISPLEDEFLKKAKITVHPNPFGTQAELIVTNIKNIPLHLELYNSMGRLLYRKEMRSNKLIIHRDELAAGLYLFQVFHQDGSLGTGRLIITD